MRAREAKATHVSRPGGTLNQQRLAVVLVEALEGLDETELLEIDRTTPIPNASVTRYCKQPDGLVLETFASDEHLDPGPAEKTDEEKASNVLDEVLAS